MKKIIGLSLLVIIIVSIAFISRFQRTESQEYKTPAEPHLPRWLKIEFSHPKIIMQDHLNYLDIKVNEPTELTAKITPLIGDFKNGSYYFRLSDGLSLVSDKNVLVKRDINIQEKETLEAKIKILANQESNEESITFGVRADYPSQAVKNTIINEDYNQSNQFLSVVEEEIKTIGNHPYFIFSVLVVRTK